MKKKKAPSLDVATEQQDESESPSATARKKYSPASMGCPVCGGKEVFEASYTNVVCAKCGSLLNETPFGIQLMEKHKYKKQIDLGVTDQQVEREVIATRPVEIKQEDATSIAMRLAEKTRSRWTRRRK